MRNGYNAKLLRKIRQVAFLADEGTSRGSIPSARSGSTRSRSVCTTSEPSAKTSPSSRPRAT